MSQFKIDFLKKLKALDDLKLPQNDYAITGSGPLAIRNIRQAQDIDILVRKTLWQDLLKVSFLHP